MKANLKSEETFYAWQSNIAMAYLDAEHQYKITHGKKYLNRTDKHFIANNAAKNFLNQVK